MFKYVHKNKNGVTFVELVIVVAIMGLVVPIAGQLWYSLVNFANNADYRWHIQSAVQLACNKFENQRDTIINAYEADVLYDPYIAGGITVTSESPFAFEWRKFEIPVDEEFDENKDYSGPQDGYVTIKDSPYVVPKENYIDETDAYTYIFSTPAYDTEGNYLGTYLFIREYGASNSKPFLEAEGFGTVPVNVKFSFTVASGGLYDDGENAGKPNPNLENTTGEYLKRTIHFDLESGLQDVTNYSVSTEFALRNAKRAINAPANNNQDRIMLDKWVNTTNNKKSAGPAGWVEGYPNATSNQSSMTYRFNDTDANGTTIISTTEIYTLQHYGNVMRFISPAAYHDKGEVASTTQSMDLAGCLGDWTFSNSINGDFYLDKIKTFRDGVLRGTEFGEWFIHEYYYTWSPFLIEHTAFLKPVYKAILIPVSYVCEFVAKL